MKKLITAVFCICTMGIYAQDTIVQSSITGMLDFNNGRILSLVEAFSDEQMDWRPSEGVRSVGETVLHTAAANYFIASKMGFAPPADVDLMTMETIQGKANIVAAYKKSAAFIKEKIAMVESGALAEEVDFGFAKMNKLSGLLVILEHNGEHKGQLIAYARSNGVVPPWSQAN